MSLWGTIMGGVNLLLHCAGWLEGGLTASFEKLIVDAEMLQMMREFLQPFDMADLDKAMTAVAEVGPGGHFFGVGHTLERFEAAFYSPLLSDWRNFETWQETGCGGWHAPRQWDLEGTAAQLRGAGDGSCGAR